MTRTSAKTVTPLRCRRCGDCRSCGPAGRVSVHRRGSGVGVENLRLPVRQKRLAGELWAIEDGHSWLFPLSQFEIDENTGGPIRQVRGLSQVFKALPSDLHPASVDGFLTPPSPILDHIRPLTPLEWLRQGGDVDRVVTAARTSDWYSR